MLTKPIALSVNRGGQSLDTAKQAAEAGGWPVIGVDPNDIVLVDAGTAIVGYGFQILNVQALIEAAVACLPDDSYVPYFSEPIPTEPTITSTFEFASTSLDSDAGRVAKHLNVDTARVTGAKQNGSPGRHSLEWIDVNGNLNAFVQLDADGLKGKRGSYYKQVLDRSGGGKGTPLLGVTLLVSDVGRSREFYEGKLGLTAVDGDRREVTLDAGNIALTLRAETQLGVVRKSRESGVMRDQYSFYTPDIEAEAANLTSQGINMGNISRSISAGALARFFDPDGHSLWLWQPQPRYVEGMPIDYTPVVSRIVGELGERLPDEGYTGR